MSDKRIPKNIKPTFRASEYCDVKTMARGHGFRCELPYGLTFAIYIEYPDHESFQGVNTVEIEFMAFQKSERTYEKFKELCEREISRHMDGIKLAYEKRAAEASV